MTNQLNAWVVDDDEIYKFTVLKSLESLNLPLNLITFPDGEKAFNAIQDNLTDGAKLPDIIFLDIEMPIMDGFLFIEEFLKVKSKISKQIEIYMVSSSLDPKDIQRAKNIGAIKDYIIKPVAASSFKIIMNSFFENRNCFNK
ncbi:response regulator [Maribacter confluentis]|uniref:Response regulator n=1 Tax=Maribacter confluentis TaxID=1656093 RepID=A0ABT8RQH6_9FLAO|nr:response regulator [Maribacter confluentis]MDO1513158.1 response regulator [Maribacter confluentis]